MKLRFTPLKLTLIFLLLSSALMAQNNYRSSGGGSGNWHDPLSWEEEVSPGTWAAASAAPDNGDGVITVQAGHTITVAAGFPITADEIVVAGTGTLTVNDVLTLNNGAGTDLQVNGTLTLVSTITGAGSAQIDGAFNWNGGTLASATTVGASGTATIQTGDKNLNTTLTSSGSITWTTSIISFNNGTINSTGVFNITGNSTMAFNSGTNAFNNNGGTVTKNAAGTTTIGIPMSNTGTLTLTSGNITSTGANGSFTNTGTIGFSAGTALTIGGTAATNLFNAGTSITGTGTLNINANLNIGLALTIPSTIAINLAAPTFTLGNAGSGSLSFDGNMSWTAGTLDVATTIGSGGTLTLSTGGIKNINDVLTIASGASMNWSGSDIGFNDGTLTNNGTLTLTSTNSLNGSSGTNTFNNNGTYNKNGPATSTIASIAINNTGIININAGTLAKAGSVGINTTNSGTINFSGGAVFTISAGAITFDPGTSITGTGTLTVGGGGIGGSINLALVLPSTITFNLASGTLANTGGSLTINGTMGWTGGSLSVPTTIASGATLNLSTTGTLSSTLTNNGTVNWTANNLSFNNGTITNDGTINATGNNVFLNGGGTNAFNNNSGATFTKSNLTGVTRFEINTTNAGTININTGTLAINAGAIFTNTGAINFSGTIFSTSQTGGSAATTNFDAGTTFTGTGTIENRNSSTTNINENITIANVVMTTGFVAGSGSMTITNTWDWQSTALSVPTTLNAGATATLAGGGARTLATTLVNNGTINWTAQTISLNNGSITNNGIFNASSGTGLLMANGGGTNTFNNTGTLQNTTTGTLTFNLGVDVTNSGNIQGIGTYTFNGSVTNTGNIRPGTTSTGILAVTPNAITGNNTTVWIQINNSTTPGTGHDQLNVTNSVNLTNATLIATEPPGDVAPIGSYTIMTAAAGTITGPFATAVIPGGWTITYNAASVVLNKVGSTLPVNWGEFTALPVNNTVELKWTTLEEQNASHFVVEHSVDGVNYTSIGIVAANGNTGSVSKYGLTHTSPNLNKLNYYRILQLDVDGKKEYSDIRSVKFSNGKVAAVLATPNPVRDRLQLSVQMNDVTVVLSDLNGNTLRVLRLKAGVHYMDMQKFASGVYNLAVYQKQVKVDSQKIIKL